MNPLVAWFLRAAAATLSAPALFQRSPLDPSEIGYTSRASSVKHNRGGTAAAKRAARKRRNVIRNRRAHRA